MTRATLVQPGHTAHRVPPARAVVCRVVSHSFRPCCFAVDAFIALGGRSDKGGEISTEKLRAVIKDFGLTIDIDVSVAALQQMPVPSPNPTPTPTPTPTSNPTPTPTPTPIPNLAHPSLSPHRSA